MIDLRTAPDEELLDLIEPDLAAATRASTCFAAPGAPWRLLHGRRRDDAALLVAALPDDGLAASAVLFFSPDGAPSGTAIAVAPPAEVHELLSLCQDGVVDALTGRRTPVRAVCFRAEPGATALQVRRRGAEATEDLPLVASGSIAVLAEWTDEPIAAFVAVERDGAWQPAFAPDVACSLRHAADCFDLPASGTGVPFHVEWVRDPLYALEGERLDDYTLKLLRGFSSGRHKRGPGLLGAAVYGNGHAFYDRLEREDALIDPAVLLDFLASERPELLPPDLARRHAAAVERATRAAGRAGRPGGAMRSRAA